MENNVFEAQKSLVERKNEDVQASIAVNLAERPQNVFRIVLDLSKERSEFDPFIVNKYFKSVFMERATNPTARVFIKPTTSSSEQDAFGLGYKDSWSVSTVVPKGFIHWEQQQGTATLVFFSDAEFKSGSQISLTSGGVSVSDGTSLSQLLPVTLVATTTTEILPQNFSRKVGTVINRTGADLWVGDSTVTNTGNTEGLCLRAGEALNWKNSAALFAYSIPGGKVVRMEQE